MTSLDLPAELKAALDARLQGLSRNDAAGRAAAISRTYRDGGGSGAITSGADALAYALVRMPATYAAVTASLNALCEITPHVEPARLLDVGAGPGTAKWAAAEAFASLKNFTLLDANPALRALGLDLARDHLRLRAMTYHRGEARATLLVVEPGTPAGCARILTLRAQVIASGAHVAVPCPHDGECPLAAPDWCHFTQRLARSRAHKQLKSAELPYEDEKFAYVALTRAPVARHPARVLAQPNVNKVEVTAKLCTAEGLVIARIPRRAKGDYSAARRWRWGDAVTGQS